MGCARLPYHTPQKVRTLGSPPQKELGRSTTCISSSVRLLHSHPPTPAYLLLAELHTTARSSTVLRHRSLAPKQAVLVQKERSLRVPFLNSSLGVPVLVPVCASPVPRKKERKQTPRPWGWACGLITATPSAPRAEVLQDNPTKLQGRDGRTARRHHTAHRDFKERSVVLVCCEMDKERKKEPRQPKGGMGGRHAATTLGALGVRSSTSRPGPGS